MKVFVVTILFFLTNTASVMAQCAMCRTTLENNFSNGDPGIATGINTGILYLLVLPYLAIMVVGYLWLRSSRQYAR